MFAAYSVEAQAPGVQGEWCHTRAKYFNTSKAGLMISPVIYNWISIDKSHTSMVNQKHEQDNNCSR